MNRAAKLTRKIFRAELAARFTSYRPINCRPVTEDYNEDERVVGINEEQSLVRLILFCGQHK